MSANKLWGDCCMRTVPVHASALLPGINSHEPAALASTTDTASTTTLAIFDAVAAARLPDRADNLRLVLSIRLLRSCTRRSLPEFACRVPAD